MGECGLPETREELDQPLPPVVAAGDIQSLEDLFGDPVEQIFLVLHVAVEGHRADPKARGQLRHGEFLETLLVGEFDRGRHDLGRGESPRTADAAQRGVLGG